MALSKISRLLSHGKCMPSLAGIGSSRNASTIRESYYDEEHKAMQATLKKIIDSEINPNVDQWEKDGEIFLMYHKTKCNL